VQVITGISEVTDHHKSSLIGLVTPIDSSTPSFSSPSNPSSPDVRKGVKRPLEFPSDSPLDASRPTIKDERQDETAAVEAFAAAAAEEKQAEAEILINFALNPIIIEEDGTITPVNDLLRTAVGKKRGRGKGKKGSAGVLKVCGTNGCTYSTKRGDHMRRHKMNMHSVGLKWHFCNIGECMYKCKRKEALVRHQASIHDETKWHSCPSFGCSFKNRAKKNIKLHVKEIHGNIVLQPPQVCLPVPVFLARSDQL